MYGKDALSQRLVITLRAVHAEGNRARSRNKRRRHCRFTLQIELVEIMGQDPKRVSVAMAPNPEMTMVAFSIFGRL